MNVGMLSHTFLDHKDTNDYDWLLDSHRQWKHRVSVCMVKDDCNWLRYSNYSHYRQDGGVSCMTELAEIFGNIFMLSDYRGNFTVKCHILFAK